MDLTVQEIIAKVALRRESQLKQKHKKHILTHINNLNIQSSTSMLIKNNNHHKSQISNIHEQQYNYISKTNEQQHKHVSKTKRNNPQNSDSFNNQIPNESILIQKHKKLKTIFHKLKSKVEHQSQINQLYKQTIKKLQLVLKKNNKLQKELDSIRSKKLAISKNSQSIKDQQSHVKSSAFFTNSVTLQKQTRPKESNKFPCKQSNKLPCKQSSKIQRTKQNHQQNNNQVQKSLSANKKYDSFDQNKAKLLTDQNKSFDEYSNFYRKNHQEREVSGFEIEYRKPTNSWCKNEIEQYKLMICEKEASIKKLRSMIEKQQKIITNYANISSSGMKQKQQSIINTGFNKGKLIQKKAQKIQGTIVKLNRVKKNSSQMRINNLQTDMNMRNKRNNNYIPIDSLETYIDGKTKKKYQEKQIEVNEQKERLYEEKERLNEQRQMKSQLVDIQQFTYQQNHKMRQSPNDWEQQQQEFNETSEFICQM